MPFKVYRCCFCFSLRLGAIIIALVSFIKVTPLIVISTQLAFSNSSTHFQRFFSTVELDKDYFQFFFQESNQRIICAVLSGLLTFYALTCIFLAIGAYLTTPVLIYPFLIANFFAIVEEIILYCLLFRYLMHMTGISSQILQTEMFELGYVIMYLTLAALYLLLEIFLWNCVYSLAKILKELHARLDENHFVHPVFFEKGVKQTPIVMVEGMTYKKSYY